MHEYCCLDRAPLVVLIEDNGYAISVPVEKQTAGGNIANLLAGFPVFCGWKWMAPIFWNPTR